MALETKAIAIDKTSYTIIGTNITSISARSRRGNPFAVVVVPTAGAAPLVGETDFTTIRGDENMTVTATAFDAYALASDLEDTLEIIRE